MSSTRTTVCEHLRVFIFLTRVQLFLVGVLFSKDFESRSDSEKEGELMARIVEDRLQEAEGYETDSGDEEDWWRPDLKIGDMVEVYFTRNGKVIGKKEIVLPKGGFYPPVGMMSSQ